MASVHEQLTEQFRQWEIRGRGWKVFSEPVCPEPPFVSFPGHFLSEAPVADDGHRPTLLSSFVQKLSRKLSTEPAAPPIVAEPEDELEPQASIRDSLIELQTSLPADLDIPKEAFEQFLSNLARCQEPIAFEILGVPQRVTAQFAACPADSSHIHRQLQAYFPQAVFLPRQGMLQSAWDSCEDSEALIIEFGLAREFILPLAGGKLDPFIGIIGALSELQAGELGLFQVLFQPVSHPWSENILASVTHSDGRPFFVNSPELAHAAENKISKRIYAAVVRVATRGRTYDRTVEIARDLSCALTVFAHPRGNELIPLANSEYDSEDNHVEDALSRETRRSGMLLNSDELIGFVHLPSSAVRSPAFLRQAGKTKPAPAVVRQSEGLLLGNNVHLGESVPVRLTAEQRVRHTHIIGASGTGKSTLLFNLIRQDIENGEGLAVLDPHGDLIDKILGIIPSNRIGDVILVDPSDEEYSVGFNILSAHSELEKTLLASDLVSVFERLSSSWGDQMQSVLQNAILAFLENSCGGTLADLRRFLIEPAFRAEFLKSVRDPNVLYYWHKAFPQLSGNKSIGPVLTRLDTFLAKKPILHMVSQPENRLDFAHIMDSGKVFLAKLPEGLLGKENTYLLGTFLISKFQQLAMSRQAKQIAARRDFWIYLDEFHNFITPSMAEILSGARKYRIGLTLAHHELRQLQRDSEVASAVLSHPSTRICFRLGDEDARKLSDGFSFFETRDLQNLGVGEAIARVERSDFDFNLTVQLPEETDADQRLQRRQEVVTFSRERYGTRRTLIEARLLEAWGSVSPSAPSPGRKIVREDKAISKLAAAAPLQAPPAIQPLDSKPAEGPAATGSGSKESLRAKLPSSVPEGPKEKKDQSESEAQEPRDLGRGGPEHQGIQKRIKEAAEELGFRCVIEHPILDRSKFIDLLLVRGDEFIACEVANTTPVKKEVEYIAKFLKEKIESIAIVSTDEDHLRKISAAASEMFGAKAAGRVNCYSPDQFIAYLRALPIPTPKPAETIRRGRKVTGSFPSLTAEEQRLREEASIRAIAEIMQQRKPRRKS